MQTVTNNLKLDYPLDLVLEVTHFDLMHNLPRYKNMLGLEEIKLLRFDENADGSHEVEFTIKSTDRLPAIAKKFVRPEMLAWRQIGRWNPQNLTFEFRVLPFFFKKLIDIRGRKCYTREGETITMEISVRINIGIPGIGRLLEQLVATELKKEQIKLLAKINNEIKMRAEA